MADRYLRVFSLQENLYACDSPIVIVAGALLKDNINGNIIAQLKLKNISDKTIKAVTVSLDTKDTAGNSLNTTTKHDYLDLAIAPWQEFGSKDPIFIADSSARSFSVEVLQVVFTDGDVWDANGAPWEQLPQTIKLIDRFRNQELVKQYQMEYGTNSIVFPQIHKDIWQCKCGEWNKGNYCHLCKASRKKLFSFVENTLEQDKDARLKREADEKEKHRQFVAKRTAKAITLIGFIAVLVLGVIVGAFIAKKIVIPNRAFNNAVALSEAGQYQEAINAFTELGDYKDSQNRVLECKYQIATQLAEDGHFEEAIHAFEKIAGYKDSKKQIEIMTEKQKELKYTTALTLVNY